MKWAYIFEVPLGMISLFRHCVTLQSKAICFEEGLPQYIHPDIKIHLNEYTTLAQVIEMIYGQPCNTEQNILTDVIDSLLMDICE